MNHHHKEELDVCVHVHQCMCAGLYESCGTFILQTQTFLSYIFMRRLSFPAPFPSTPSPPSRPRPNKALESGIRTVSLTARAKAPLSSKTFSVFTNISMKLHLKTRKRGIFSILNEVSICFYDINKIWVVLAHAKFTDMMLWCCGWLLVGVDRLSAWPIIGADIKHFTDYRYRPF